MESEKANLLDRLKFYEKTKQISSPVRKAYNNITTQIRQLRRKLRKSMPQMEAHLKASIKQESENFSVGYFPPASTSPWHIEVKT